MSNHYNNKKDKVISFKVNDYYEKIIEDTGERLDKVAMRFDLKTWSRYYMYKSISKSKTLCTVLDVVNKLTDKELVEILSRK